MSTSSFIPTGGVTIITEKVSSKQVGVPPKKIKYFIQALYKNINIG